MLPMIAVLPNHANLHYLRHEFMICDSAKALGHALASLFTAVIEAALAVDADTMLVRTIASDMEMSHARCGAMEALAEWIRSGDHVSHALDIGLLPKLVAQLKIETDHWALRWGLKCLHHASKSLVLIDALLDDPAMAKDVVAISLQHRACTFYSRYVCCMRHTQSRLMERLADAAATNNRSDVLVALYDVGLVQFRPKSVKDLRVSYKAYTNKGDPLTGMADAFVRSGVDATPMWGARTKVSGWGDEMNRLTEQLKWPGSHLGALWSAVGSFSYEVPDRTTNYEDSDTDFGAYEDEDEDFDSEEEGLLCGQCKMTAMSSTTAAQVPLENPMPSVADQGPPPKAPRRGRSSRVEPNDSANISPSHATTSAGPPAKRIRMSVVASAAADSDLIYLDTPEPIGTAPVVGDMFAFSFDMPVVHTRYSNLKRAVGASTAPLPPHEMETGAPARPNQNRQRSTPAESFTLSPAVVPKPVRKSSRRAQSQAPARSNSGPVPVGETAAATAAAPIAQEGADDDSLSDLSDLDYNDHGFKPAKATAKRPWTVYASRRSRSADIAARRAIMNTLEMPGAATRASAITITAVTTTSDQGNDIEANAAAAAPLSPTATKRDLWRRVHLLERQLKVYQRATRVMSAEITAAQQAEIRCLAHE
ncbi:hypothetical protein BC828DRAFT_399161 [Blastocladiella britannica]|nr:hypothetical protein BC828DRAFT_399161 [Blastocladiella britannica]